MAEILPFKRPSKARQQDARREQAKGKTLCKSGFHRWEVDTERKFDVKQGKLVTLYRCSRCGQTKVKAL